MNRSVSDKPLFKGWLMALTAAWIFFSAVLVIAGYILSWIGMLNWIGYVVTLLVAFAVAAWPLHSAYSAGMIRWRLRKHRYKRVFPLLFVACFLLALVGGAIHPPTNYDAFCYRITRILFWLQEGSYHWTNSFCLRMDFSSLGFEWLMLPGMAVFGTLRLAFLINIITYLLMPGLIYKTLRHLGVRGSVASTWMWIIPCASCFAMQAGSIGNDITATIYLLAAITFALQARNSGSGVHLALAIIAAGLCTCAKASNLPLALPISICILAALAKHPRLTSTAACAAVIGIAVSFVPLAVMNHRKTGDWTGSPNSIQNLSNPVSGIAGNTLQLAAAGLTPAVFPFSPAWNQWTKAQLSKPPLDQIRQDFPEITLRTAEMANEEGSGLGFGVMGAMILSLIGASRYFRFPNLKSIGIWVAVGFWIAFLTVIAKLGNPSIPRIVACYYPGILILPLLLLDHGQIVRSKIWKTASFLLILPILPALVFNPARPIMRLDYLAKDLDLDLSPRLTTRLTSVYEVYAERSDGHRKVRELLPPASRNIGFAGTDGDSSYSFWLPLGTRVVRDFAPINGEEVPAADGLDVIVTSDWGSDDRFGITPEELAAKLGWRIGATVPIRRMANPENGGDMRWCILVPASHLEGR